MSKLLPKYTFGALFILLVTFAVFFALEFNSNNPYFSGYDSFYHIGIAEQIMKSGLPHKFPYLYYTTLNDNFTDNHLLFHLLLIPFIAIFGNIVGPKLFIVITFSLIFTFLYIFLKKLKFEWALLFTAIAFFLEPSDFYFRQAFIRDPTPSLLFLILAIWFLAEKRWKILTALAFLYGWLYTGGGFLFLVALLLIYGFVSVFIRFSQSGTVSKQYIKSVLKLTALPIFATGLSLIINPYFPANVKSIFLQVLETGIGAKDYVGGEWAPYDTWFWVGISYVPLLIWFSAIVIALHKKVKINRIAWTVFFFSILLLFLQWKSKRFVEYWPFFAILSGILLAGKQIEEWGKNVLYSLSSQVSVAKPVIRVSKIQKSKHLDPRLRGDDNNIIKFYAQRIGISLLIIILFIVSYSYASKEWSRAWHDTASSLDFNVDAAKEAHNYLIDNSNSGDIVFTDDWDVFPLYFYLNQKDYYIVGLDPEFMNQYNPKLYREFAAISSGSSSGNMERIKTDFNAKWVIVASDHPDFLENLQNQPGLFKQVFLNEEYTVFKVL